MILAGLFMITIISWNAYWSSTHGSYPKLKVMNRSLWNKTVLDSDIDVMIGDTQIEKDIVNTSQVNYTVTVSAQNKVDMEKLNQSNERHIEVDNAIRKTSIQRACANYPRLYSYGSPYRKVYSNLYVDEKYRLIYCAIPKVGSSNWIRTMARMRGVSEEKAAKKNPWKFTSMYVRKLKQYSEAEQQQMLEDYYKVVFVREPIDRLLSAYKDKLGNTIRHDKIWLKMYGRQIIRLFRPNATQEEIQRGNDTTFKEFVQYLIRKKPNNLHWMQYHKLCRPCQLKYDFIGKYETMDRDAEFILRKVGVEGGIIFPKMYKTRLGGKDHFFKSLSTEDYKSLWDVYYADFLMFNYSYPDYLHLSDHH